MQKSSPESSPDTNDCPLVSVVMPAYNAERYVASAIQSIVDQTLADWELIVVNDGSVDGTAGLLADLDDPRIHVITHTTNAGLPRSLNAGVRSARGRYIARLDADDIMAPERLARQISFLKHNPDLDIIGTAARAINEQGKPGHFLWRPQRPVAVRFLALWETPFHHPTVMARAHVLKEHPYDERYSRSEDYDLWSRLIFDYGARAANIPESLTLFRQHAQSFTKTVGTRGLEFAVGIPIRNMSRYMTLSETERNLVSAYRSGHRMSTGQLLRFNRFIWKVTTEFWRQERPTLRDAPTIARIAAGTFWRTMRKSWKHR